eukprot:TRINITY_DN51934_c0_g1_i1.p1 TRINITY_DN51934_c0_g1~~TRINITY_DN51934_c0_g1_i1.p1  ORF type:complete len:560 (-),score=140.76 TRINITY_DN51934_c0_g1_i1:33-1712(-)
MFGGADSFCCPLPGGATRAGIAARVPPCCDVCLHPRTTSWTCRLVQQLSTHRRDSEGDGRSLGIRRAAAAPKAGQAIRWARAVGMASASSSSSRSVPAATQASRHIGGSPQAANVGLIGSARRPESFYVADLLTPDGQISPEQPITRKLLTSRKAFALKPRDVATLLARSPRLGFDLNVRDGAVVLTLGGDGPSYVVGARSAWIFHRVTGSTVAKFDVAMKLQSDGVPGYSSRRRPSRRQRLKSFLKKFLRQKAAAKPFTDHEEPPVHGITSERLRQRFLEVEGMPGSGSAEMLGLALPSDEAVDMDVGLNTQALSKVNTSRLSVPFTLAVVEAALSVFVEKLESNMRKQVVLARQLISSVERVVEEMRAGSDAVDLDQIRMLKQRLGRIDAVSSSLKQTLFSVLGDEDDMQSLASDVCEKTACTEEDWELCFEYYLQKAEEIQAEAQQQNDDLEDLESLIGLSISRRRLELEQVSLWLDVVGAGLGVGSVLTGALGMNLLSGLEDKRYGFQVASVCVAAVSCSVCWALRLLVLRRLRRRRPEHVLLARRPNEGFVPVV